MKTTLKIIKTIGLILVISLSMTLQVYGQHAIVFDNATMDDQEFPADPYEIGDANYTITLEPLGVTPGDTYFWEIVNISDLDEAGLKMAFGCPTPSYSEPDCTAFTLSTSEVDATIVADGNTEILHFIPDASETPMPSPGVGYEIELEVTKNDTITESIILTIPVIEATRDPISVVMVLDRSGSMNWELGTNNNANRTEDSRWGNLEVGVQIFKDEFTAPGIAVENDQLGIIYFESDTETVPLAEPNTISLLGSPGGSTAMGKGLFDAKTLLNSARADNRKIIFLFTDGDQNINPLATVDGRTLSDGTSFHSDDTEIYPIAIYGPGDYPEILQQIADANNDDGVAFFMPGVDTPSNPELLNFDLAFLNTLNTILENSSPQLIETKIGSFSSEGTANATFTVNDRLSQLYFSIVSSDTLNTNTQFKKDGMSIPWSHASSNGRTNYYTIEFPPKNPNGGIVSGLENLTSGGEWNVSLSGAKGQTFRISAIGNDHFLNIDYELNKSTVDNPISTTVTLDLLGTPITNADTVSWLVLKPGDHLGDLLSTTNADFGVSDDQDAGSAGLQKYFSLLESNPDFRNALTANENLIQLTNNGDGSYSGIFTNVDTTGDYQFVYFIEGEDPNIGTYIRTYYRSAVISFDSVDEEASEFSSVATSGGIDLFYRPAYTIGSQVHFVGPAYANGINVYGNNLTVDTIIDMQDGTYQIVLLGDPQSDISVSLLDKEVYNGPASSFDDGKNSSFIDKTIDWITDTLGIPAWLAWILLILLILLIIWLIRKLTN